MDGTGRGITTTNRRDGMAGLGLAAVAAMWSLPFLQPRHYLPLPTFYGEWLAFALGLVAMVLLATRRAWSHGRLPALALPPLALAAVILVQAAAGRVPYAGQALAATCYLVWASGLVVLGAELRRRLPLTRLAAVLAGAILAAGILTAAAGAVQHYGAAARYGLVVWHGVGGVYGNLAQRNHYADYLCLALAACAYLYAAGRLRSAVAALLAAVLIFGLGLAASRAPWLYLATMLGVALLVQRRRPSAEGVRLARAAAVIYAAFALDELAMALLSSGETSLGRIASGVGLDARLQIARSALAMFAQAPLAGMGWGSFGFFDFERRAALAAPVALGVTDNAHNLLLHFLAETGLAGGAIVLAALVVWLLDARKAATIESAWLTLVVAVLGVHSMVEFPLWQAYFLGIAAVAAGLAAERTVVLPPGRIVPAGCGVILAALAANVAAIGYNYRQLEQLSAVGRRDVPGTVGALATLAERDVVLRPLAELAMANRMTLSPEFVAHKLELNARVLHFFPAPMVVFRHAALLALAGEPDAARTWLVRGAHVYPQALAQAQAAFGSLAAAHPAEIAPLLELASAKIPPPAPAAP